MKRSVKWVGTAQKIYRNYEITVTHCAWQVHPQRVGRMCRMWNDWWGKQISKLSKISVNFRAKVKKLFFMEVITLGVSRTELYSINGIVQCLSSKLGAIRNGQTDHSWLFMTTGDLVSCAVKQTKNILLGSIVRYLFFVPWPATLKFFSDGWFIGISQNSCCNPEVSQALLWIASGASGDDACCKYAKGLLSKV